MRHDTVLNEPRSNRFRIELTVSCEDCAPIPKVGGAGKVFEEAGTQYQLMHNGARVISGGYHGGWMSEIIERLEGHHEPQEEVVFHEILRHVGPAATMVELRAFWSYFSLWFLRGFEERRAIVLEPDPSHLTVGRANALLNGAACIEFTQGSVGAVSAGPQPFPTETSGTLEIPEFAVTDILAGREIDVLDILHCDTQGAETSVIASCEALFKARKIRFGIFSTHAYQISGDALTHQKCLSMLKDFGGQILAEHDVHESFSGDWLIAVYFGTGSLAWSAPKLSFNRYSNGIFRNPIYDLAEAQQALKLAAQPVLPQAAPQALTEPGPKSLLSRLFAR